MASMEIGGYTYYDTEAEVRKKVKSSDDVVAFEGGLGWYIYSRKEYANNPRKKLFGF
jgi:hypothetical protein